ncbi:MAG TPA: DUF296 domain-containing protein [Candidatus Omnitrophota bacterium]|nr:DUF296 domain-containing protein [Candidatus Omnitrophota bacterium]HPS20466.1 DUF296 domain-containing protein [Candidatus Omnitrophota bacterium]
MRYGVGRTGRVFIVKFDHGDDVIAGLKALMAKEDVDIATVAFIGALEKGDIVTGPRKKELPAKPNWTIIDNVWETVGYGVLTKKKNTVKFHLHGAYGKRGKALAGCLRRNAKVFITVEALVTEIKGVKVSREMDETIGHETLKFK